MSKEDLVPETDWGGLPKDILQCIYTQLFAADETSPLPLGLALSQVTALSLVCKHWAEALTDDRPELHLAIGNAPPHILRTWVPIFPIKTLHVANYLDLDRLNIGEQSNVLAARVSADCMVPLQQLDHHHHRIDLQIGALRHLRCLTLDCPEAWRDGIMFIAAPLHSLSNLKVVCLRGFKGYELHELPNSIQELTLGYGEPYVHDILSSHTMDMPELPAGFEVERLKIEKNGIVGICLDKFWDLVGVLEVDALFVLAGVPVKNRDLVTFFERPYREGAYVPPHILGDWDAVEASNRAADQTADDFLLGIATSSKLQSLKFIGKCAKSVKMVPGTGGDLERSLVFLHAVVSHAGDATFFLFGLCGAELLDRSIDLRSAGKLGMDSLNVYLSDGIDMDEFEIVVKERMRGRRVVGGNGGEEKEEEIHDDEELDTIAW